MASLPKHEKIKDLEEYISLVMMKDDIVPYQIIVEVVAKDDMACPPPAPYVIPSNEKGTESFEIARRIKIEILKKVYPDDWEIRHITPQDRFATNEPLKENSAGYHYVRFKLPNKTFKYPSFEARVYNPETRRMVVILNKEFGKPYSGDTIESAFVSCCIAVDGFYGNPEKSFRTYTKYLNKEAIPFEEFEDFIIEAKKAAQEEAKRDYLRKYLVSSQKDDRSSKKPSTNLFSKKDERDFPSLKGFYPYIYINHKNKKWVLSAVVPEFENSKGTTLGTFNIDEKNTKTTWKQLAKLVDGHFKREIRTNSYYASIAPTFADLVAKVKSDE
jgi:hypothetical protein